VLAMSNTKTRKLTIVRTPTDPLRLEPGEAVHVGVDVHKASYSVIKSFLLQHGIAEPAGLGHWSKASVAVLRGLELLPELQFCLDLFLDELAHA
jgi:hypothetical protein